MTSQRIQLEAQIKVMNEGVDSAMADLDAKLTDLYQFTVTNAALAQDAHDIAADAADIARRLASSLSLFAGKFTELKAEFPVPFRVPAIRRDVITALCDAGIEVVIVP